jgi:hypothetical protein
VKRIRYLTGAVGLAPVAIGMALPAAANAATSAGAPSGVKTVSLHHSGIRTVAAAVGCTGNTRHNFPQSGHIAGHFWATPHHSSVCIGTVVVSLFFTKSFCKSAQASVIGGTQSTDIRKHRTICGVNGEWVTTSFSIHTLWDQDVSVCATSQYGGNHMPCVQVKHT